MRYLVTGGAGFIGSHLTDSLLAQGNEVLIFDDFSTGNRSNLAHLLGNNELETVSGSILDRQALGRVISGVDGCFHLAAAVGVEKILKDPIGSIKTNIHGTENVLELCSDQKIPVLLASTSEIYGKNSEGTLNEDSDRIVGSPLLSRWTYSDAKALDEAFAIALHHERNLEVKIIRFFNTVGPRQSAAYGMVIPKFFKAALSNQPLVIYGDGSQRRIFCHVSDAISGILALWGKSEANGDVFNLGGIEETTIIHLANKILEITKSKSEVQFLPYSELKKRGFEDIQRRLPDISKIENLTSWKPLKGLDEILHDYHRFLMN